MTDVIEAMDDAYKRAEKKYSSIEKQKEWLLSFGGKGGGNTYELAAIKVGQDLEKGIDLERDYKKTGEVAELQKMQKEAKALKFYNGNVSSDIQTKIDNISKELSELTEKRREERLIEEAKEKERLAEEQREIRRQERLIAQRIAQEERLKSEDKRKVKNAKRQLEKMKERGEI